jgi:TatD DNase family protein
MFIDTHTHLDFDLYNEDREAVIQRALAGNTSAIITIGTDIKSSEAAIALSEKYAPVFAAVGIHPTDCAAATYKDIEKIETLAAHEKVVAIGEIGLDYYHMEATKEQQRKIFSEQVKLAQKIGKPMIIHNRDSHEDMLQCIEKNEIESLGAVMHSFSGDLAFLEKILLANIYVSFTGNITFKKSTADELVKQTPLERLLLETDSPFLTPEPLRGKRNEPAFIKHTAEKIANLKAVDIEEIAQVTSQNAKELFKLNI